MIEVFGKLIGYLFGYLVVWPLVKLMTLPWGPFARPIAEVLKLEKLSATWPYLRQLYAVIKIVAGFFFFAALLMLVVTVLQPWNAFSLGTLVGGILMAPAASFIFFTLCLLEVVATDPDTQRRRAGRQAEEAIERLLRAYASKNPECRLLNGALLVFNIGMADEFSVELDHVLITRHRVFVIETKYKSGTIWATAGASEWKVLSDGGESFMRNALVQVKNSASQLRRELNLSTEVVPFVAIYGNDVQIIDGPSNVVAADGLLQAIQAFLGSPQDVVPADIEKRLLSILRTDKVAKDRHVARAEAAKARHHAQQIVQRASLE